MRSYPKTNLLTPGSATNWMLLLLALFALRVLAQPAALYWPGAWLPAFDDWHSAALPYALLLFCQSVILLGAGTFLWRVYQGRQRHRPRLGRLFVRLGWVYWLVMAARLLLGLTVLRHVHWFAQTLPALFHLLLANFLMLAGAQLRGSDSQKALR